MKKKLFLLVLLLQSVCMYSQELKVVVMRYNEKYNIPGGAEGKNYAAIVKTDESKDSLVFKSLEFMKSYGFVPEDIDVDNIDISSSEASFPVLVPLTMFYQEMAVYEPNKLYCDIRFEFHDSNVMIVFENFHNKVLGVYTKSLTKKEPSDLPWDDYTGELGGLITTKTWIGKFLIHANLDPDERKNFRMNADQYFSNISDRFKTYEKLVNGDVAKWMTSEELAKQYTEYPVPGSKYAVKWLNSPETKDPLIAISEKRWKKQVKEFFNIFFRAFCIDINGTIEGIAEDGVQTWEIVNDNLVPTDPNLQKKYLKKSFSFYDEE